MNVSTSSIAGRVLERVEQKRAVHGSDVDCQNNGGCVLNVVDGDGAKVGGGAVFLPSVKPGKAKFGFDSVSQLNAITVSDALRLGVDDLSLSRWVWIVSRMSKKCQTCSIFGTFW